MVRKILAEWNTASDRFEHVHATLGRVVRGHAWFEDQVFFPAMDKEPVFARQFMGELWQEHKDIDALLDLITKTSAQKKELLDYYVLQLKSVLETHFAKEEDALFPICEKILTEEGLVNLGAEMRRRKNEKKDETVS